MLHNKLSVIKNPGFSAFVGVMLELFLNFIYYARVPEELMSSRDAWGALLCLCVKHKLINCPKELNSSWLLKNHSSYKPTEKILRRTITMKGKK